MVLGQAWYVLALCRPKALPPVGTISIEASRGLALQVAIACQVMLQRCRADQRLLISDAVALMLVLPGAQQDDDDRRGALVSDLASCLLAVSLTLSMTLSSSCVPAESDP